MIRVDRSGVPSPLNPDLVGAIKAQLRIFYSQSPDVRRKQRPDPKGRLTIGLEARDALMKVFRNKCGYCESNIGTTSHGEIDYFRPFTDASNLSGEGSPDHYGWLSADWDNIYLACPACARAKRSLFPVEGERAEVLTPLETVRQAERALLVDPCFDDPAEHLRFGETGYVEALSSKGEVTIKVLNLNRLELVQARLHVWRRTFVTAEVPERSSEILLLVAAEQPYAAVARAAVRAFDLAKRANEPQVVRQIARQVPREIRSAEQILADDAEAFRLTARPLRRVEITNFRALRNLSINFGEPGSERAPWLMLLGENATGKSTVLQAIALALAGADEARRFTRPARLLSVGTFEGSIMIWFWDQDAPVELRFRRHGGQFEGTRRPSAIVLGYGALRYAERRQRGIQDHRLRFTTIAPLMQPIARVAYPGGWLLSLDAKRFETAARALQSILPVAAGSVMLRSGNRIYFDVGDHRATLGELSAGYQTVVGMCADIMRHLFSRWDTLASAAGIVLIDEIDAHLHPRWTMRIVRALREAFPQVQFIASTHNPLALRGLRNGEVALLRRDAAGVVIADQNLPPLEGMQVDQLLTSRVFGLESTVDPETEALLNEYYHLRSLPPDPTRLARLEEIRGSVADREALGRSETERLMLQVTNEFVRDTATRSATAPSLRGDTLERLREIADRRASRRRPRQE
jgi:hypothetical protein